MREKNKKREIPRHTVKRKWYKESDKAKAMAALRKERELRTERYRERDRNRRKERYREREWKDMRSKRDTRKERKRERDTSQHIGGERKTDRWVHRRERGSERSILALNVIEIRKLFGERCTHTYMHSQTRQAHTNTRGLTTLQVQPPATGKAHTGLGLFSRILLITLLLSQHPWHSTSMGASIALLL